MDLSRAPAIRNKYRVEKELFYHKNSETKLSLQGQIMVCLLGVPVPENREKAHQ
jgi:hypothetical protein